MNIAYHFRVGPMCFILNPQYSDLGYCHPRIFVSFPDDSYLNCDLSIRTVFPMSKDDYLSWLDGTQTTLQNMEEIREACKECGVNWDAFHEVALQMYEKHK